MSEDNDKNANNSESKSEDRSRNTDGNTGRNKRIKTALIAAFVLVMFVFSGIVIYIYISGQGSSPAVYYVAPEQSVQITETRTIETTETADNPGVNNDPVLNEDAAGYNSGAYGGDSAYDFLQLKKEPKKNNKVLSTGCINEFTFEENCNAPSGCIGTRTKMCINNEWSYTTNCTSNLIKCSHGSCMEQCKDDKNYFIEKYRITNNKTLIFYYADEPHSDAMLPFMQSMERVLLLKYGEDTSFEQYLNLFGTVPSLICFDNYATTTGEKTQEEVESFKAASC